LRQTAHVDLLRFTTAGSVDDGKSTLIGRLLQDCKSIYEDQLAAMRRDSQRLNREGVDLALLTDGLKAEREQAITIDVAYRYFSTPRRRFIIADTPGHEQYTRNMATGASTADLAIILMDARQGVLTQSKRHGFIASLLGIPHVIVAVNKMDLVDYSEAVFERIRREYADFTAKLTFRDMSFIPISALKGDNVVHHSRRMPWYQGTTLLAHLENVQITGDRNLIDFRFPIQYVNRPNLTFRGYCGSVASGVVRVGDEVMALPSGRTTRVKSIVTYDGELPYAFPPQAVTLCLEDELDISRGDMLVHPRNLPRQERNAEALLVWMSTTPFAANKPYMIKHLTSTVRASFDALQYRINPNTLHREPTDRLDLNEIGRVGMEFFRPMMFDEYARNRATGSFIVIDPATNGTVGAGMIIERVRRQPLARSGRTVSQNIRSETGLVSDAQRHRLLGQRPATVWLTGLSCSGKSTVARNLEKTLVEARHACCVLDGDNIRHGLNRDLGFAPHERTENIRRIAEVARLMNDAGLIVITAFISPYRADRRRAREIIGEGRFIEVFLDAPLETCEQRDVKGLYKKARTGKIEGFTGVTAPYEMPERPELRLLTGRITPDEAVAKITAFLRRRRILPAAGGRTTRRAST
jgi:bifunctional enzyme CysN/CysC